MEFNEMNMEQVEARIAEIKTMLTAEDADIEALSAETDGLLARKAAIKAAAEEKRSLLEKVAQADAPVIEKHEEPQEARKTMDSKEIRNSSEYINAYVDYIKGKNKGEECRALLTQNAPSDGTIPVPTYLEERIETAWEDDQIMSRVKRSFFKGNLKVGVEYSSTGADLHEEGAAAGNEEILAIQVVELVPKTIKKWITISDEVMDVRGQAFLDYIYDEIEYQIIKFAGEAVIGTALNSTYIETQRALDYTLSTADLINALSHLSASAQNRVFISSPAQVAAIRIAALSAGYAYDPFVGLTVIENDYFTAYSGTVLGLVGDLSAVQANFPAGDQVTFKFDDLSLAEKDLVKVVGRLPIAIGLVRMKSLVQILEPEGN